jgi:hypothetical protein
MAPNEPDPTLQALEIESEDEFLNRVEVLVTGEADTMRAMRNLRELCIVYEARAGFLVELKERFEQALIPDSGVTVPDGEELLELLGAHEDEIRAEWDATEPVPDVTILEVLWPDEPAGD